MGSVLVVGSSNVDHVLQVASLPERGETLTAAKYTLSPGGKGLNQAVASSRLGAPTAMATAVGTDPAGDELVSVLDAEGIDRRRLVRVAATPTGVAVVTVADDGSNTVVVVPGANATLRPPPAADLAGFAVVLCQLEIPLDTVEASLSAGRRANAVTVLNAAPAPASIATGLLASVDVLVVNETEALCLAGCSGVEAMRALAGLGPATVVLTLGERGALVASGGSPPERLEPFDVHPVDTTAAGDAFCGALAAALAAGSDMVEAATRGCAAGAVAATRLGAVPSLPNSNDVDRLIAARGARQDG